MRTSKDPRRRHLRLRGATWYLNLPIPHAIRHLYPTEAGTPKTHIVESLGTADLNEAARCKALHLARWVAEFRRKEREAAGILPTELDEAQGFRQAIAKASVVRDPRDPDGPTERDLREVLVFTRADEIAELGGSTPESIQRAQTFADIALGRQTLDELFNEWTSNSALPSRTVAKYRTALDEFTAFLGKKAAFPEDMTRANAIAYADWLNREGRSQRTKKLVPLSMNAKRDRLMALSAFWSKGLELRQKATGSVNPFTRLMVTPRPTASAIQWDDMGNAGRPVRRPDLNADDLLAILDAPGPREGGATRYGKRTLMEVFCLGLLTGARSDEIASLRLRDIKRTDYGYLVTFPETKTEAQRAIPVAHEIASSIIRRRIGNRISPEEQLFAEFRAKAGTDSIYELVGRGLRRHLKKAAGLPEGAVPYCTRHTLQTEMGNREEVRDAVMQAYVGHRPESMTDKHYRRITQETLLAFARQISYPARVEQRMREELGLPTASSLGLEQDEQAEAA